MKQINKKNIFITGASKGIGYYLATQLADNGYTVFAGVRREEDAQKLLNYSEQIRPVLIDVTQRQQIAAAYQQINAHVGDEGLYALINNAGISTIGPLEFFNDEDMAYL